ncbi:MAG TPA: hypothetical protein VEL76_19005 [Gemmataceae bacterium]|nr:hypothetical protein [Gemmataceae bacterium]
MKPAKKGDKKPTATKHPTGNEELAAASRMHVIRFPNDEARMRSIEVMFDVLLPVQVYEGGINVVYGAHIQALERAGVPFEDLSEAARKHGKKKSRKTTRLPPEGT